MAKTEHLTARQCSMAIRDPHASNTSLRESNRPVHFTGFYPLCAAITRGLPITDGFYQPYPAIDPSQISSPQPGT